MTAPSPVEAPSTGAGATPPPPSGTTTGESAVTSAAVIAPSAVAAAAAPAAPAAGKSLELKLPEGADAKAFESYRALAAEVGLDSPKAQKVLDTFVALDAQRMKAAEDAFAVQDAKWAAEIQADAEVGGAKYKGALVDVRRALDRFGGRPFAQLLDRAGLGNHPTIFKSLAAIGRAFAEDSVAGTSAGAGNGERPALHEVLYPTMRNKEQ